jgi:hypothetical protein
MVPTAATVLLANALGAAIGPLFASELMTLQGPRALFLFTAIAQALLAAYVFYRTTVRPPLPAPEKTDFDLAATAPVGAMVTGETPDPSHPSVVVPETYVAPANDADATVGQSVN